MLSPSFPPLSSSSISPFFGSKTRLVSNAYTSEPLKTNTDYIMLK